MTVDWACSSLLAPLFQCELAFREVVAVERVEVRLSEEEHLVADVVVSDGAADDTGGDVDGESGFFEHSEYSLL